MCNGKSGEGESHDRNFAASRVRCLAAGLFPWAELVDCEVDLDSINQEWVFRGHSQSSWLLDSTLERAFSPNVTNRKEIAEIEEDLLIDFWRHYDLHSVAPPPRDNDTLAWLSLMRHYGAPTRLTDFTRSLFIAAYFALEDAKGESAIWAISKTWLTTRTHSLIGQMGDETLLGDWGNRVGDAFDRIFFQVSPQLFVSAASPAKMHERLAIQQSIFLCPGDVSASFLEESSWDGRLHRERSPHRVRGRTRKRGNSA